MKTLLLSVLLLVSFFSLSSCGDDPAKTDGTTATESAEVDYACPMHPEVTSSEPADCHICGMPLELMKDEEGEHDHEH